jgi:hypothetical protein
MNAIVVGTDGSTGAEAAVRKVIELARGSGAMVHLVCAYPGRSTLERLGLTGRCEVANDAFFLKDSADHAWSQRFLELKYELRLDVDAETTIAVGSFNFHERFFADSFRIGSGADHVHTACVGFGLERLTYAFLCRHGLDPARWPEVSTGRSALRFGGG